MFLARTLVAGLERGLGVGVALGRPAAMQTFSTSSGDSMRLTGFGGCSECPATISSSATSARSFSMVSSAANQIW